MGNYLEKESIEKEPGEFIVVKGYTDD